MVNKNALCIVFLVANLLNICATAQLPTIAKLNTLWLYPAAPGQYLGKKFKTIAEWYKKIRSEGFPPQGNILAVANTFSPYWHFQQGVPSNQKSPIFIHSCPRDDTLGRLVGGKDGHAFRCLNAWINNGIINGPCITFDYFFDADEFDFGQGINIKALRTIYTQTTLNNPQIPIIIVGTCIGSKIALEFTASHYTPQIQAMILESPFLDVNKVIANWAPKYLSWLPFGNKKDTIESTLTWYFPQLENCLKLPHADLSKINPDLPIFIAHLDNDSFYTNQDMADIIKSLKKHNPHIYLLVIKDSKLTHGRLTNKLQFAQASNAFLATYNLPHNKNHALNGQKLLRIACQNAQKDDPKTWQIIDTSE